MTLFEALFVHFRNNTALVLALYVLPQTHMVNSGPLYVPFFSVEKKVLRPVSSEATIRTDLKGRLIQASLGLGRAANSLPKGLLQ